MILTEALIKRATEQAAEEEAPAQVEYVKDSGRFVRFAKCPKCKQVFSSNVIRVWGRSRCEQCGQRLAW